MSKLYICPIAKNDKCTHGGARCMGHHEPHDHREGCNVDLCSHMNLKAGARCVVYKEEVYKMEKASSKITIYW